MTVPPCFALAGISSFHLCMQVAHLGQHGSYFVLRIAAMGRFKHVQDTNPILTLSYTGNTLHKTSDCARRALILLEVDGTFSAVIKLDFDDQAVSASFSR